MSKLEVKIVENGSQNHPFYVRIFVDDHLVDQKSFMSEKKAENGKMQFVMDTLENVTRKLRAVSEAMDKLDECRIRYPGEPSTFRGTGHSED